MKNNIIIQIQKGMFVKDLQQGKFKITVPNEGSYYADFKEGELIK